MPSPAGPIQGIVVDVTIRPFCIFIRIELLIDFLQGVGNVLPEEDT